MDRLKEKITALQAQLQTSTSHSETQMILNEIVATQQQLIQNLEESKKAVADANIHISELYMDIEDAQDLILQQKNEILQQNEELNASIEQLTMLNDHLQELKKEQASSIKVKKSHSALVSSINYSQRIQANLLPKPENVQKGYQGFFALYLPKDIVSGDYYWFHSTHQYNILVSADCTGHGVSGAFMTLIGFNLLDKLVCQWGIYNPSELMHEMNQELRKTLKQTSGSDVRDSMEMTIMIDHKAKNEVQIASAKRPFLVYKNGVPSITKGDKYPVGDAFYPIKPYITHTFPRKKGDRYYFFSDGITDQFGGPHNSKLTTKGFVKLLTDMQEQPISVQQFNLQQFFKRWKDGKKQLDDVMVLGLEL